jgi:hypothetical protein
LKYDYGQEVICRLSTEEGTATTKPCSVVAITPIETAKQAEVFGHPLGTVMYTVEFADGSDKLVSESDLTEL